MCSAYINAKPDYRLTKNLHSLITAVLSSAWILELNEKVEQQIIMIKGDS
jgi:hypothetical protein